ncbi:MAG TPA: hypothetical protein DD400_03085 [Rhodospirillaceae bacterium]|nr:hypothetical protein [Rhodospirillaceae bacterium]
MQENEKKNSEAWTLAAQIANRYGRLALTRAAGEAAQAQRLGDCEKSALWTSVVATLREAVLNNANATA